MLARFLEGQDRVGQLDIQASLSHFQSSDVVAVYCRFSIPACLIGMLSVCQ